MRASGREALAAGALVCRYGLSLELLITHRFEQVGLLRDFTDQDQWDVLTCLQKVRSPSTLFYMAAFRR